MKRRAMLASCSLLTAGCVTNGGENEDQGTVTDCDPTPEPAKTCDSDGMERLPHPFATSELRYGRSSDESDGDVTLEATPRRVMLGSQINFTLRNDAETSRETGTETAFSLDRYTDEGWREFRVRPEGEDIVYSMEGYSHPPGEGHEWSFEVTTAGFSRPDPATVCPNLAPGWYRFVYWGFPDDVALATCFEVIEDVEDSNS